MHEYVRIAAWPVMDRLTIAVGIKDESGDHEPVTQRLYQVPELIADPEEDWELIQKIADELYSLSYTMRSRASEKPDSAGVSL